MDKQNSNRQLLSAIVCLTIKNLDISKLHPLAHDLMYVHYSVSAILNKTWSQTALDLNATWVALVIVYISQDKMNIHLN